MCQLIVESDNYHLSIDATMGNGHDTLRLAKHSDKVLAFDIQEKALEETKKRLEGFSNVLFIQDSHENIASYAQEEIDLVLFNCGYLPGGDKEIHTDATSVIVSIESLLSRLSETGRILIVTYPGTDEGKAEDEEIAFYVKNMKQNYMNTFTFQHLNGSNMPPKLYILQRNAR